MIAAAVRQRRAGADDDLDRRAARGGRRRSPAASAASSRWTRAGRGARASPASPSRGCSRPARRSRSSPPPARWKPELTSPSHGVSGVDEGATCPASSSRTPTASRAAARSSYPSPSRATRCSLRSAPSSARAAWSTSPSASASTATPTSPARHEHDPVRRGDRRRARGRLDGDRPGRVQATALQMATWRDDRPARAPAGDRRSTSTPRAAAARHLRVTSAAGRADGRADHARRRPRRHRRRGGDRRRRGRRQDRDRRAGKTTTCEPDPDEPESCPPQDQADDPTDTDAWFAAYAPAGKGGRASPSGVLLVAAGAGGDTAAPAARDVLAAGLKAATSAPVGARRRGRPSRLAGAAGVRIAELQRAVLEVRGRDLEEQHRALDRRSAPPRSPASGGCSGAAPPPR